MDKSKEIKEVIKSIVGVPGMMFVIGKVESVGDETCSVKIADRIVINDVRLNASADGNADNILIKPKVGSMVLMADLSGGELRSLVVISFSALESMTVKFEGDVVINGGDNEGLVKVVPLKDRLNAIENDINSLKQVFSASWVPVVYDGGASLKAAAASWAAQTLATTSKEDIENPKIKH